MPVILPGPNWVDDTSRGPVFQTKAWVRPAKDDRSYWAKAQADYRSYDAALAGHRRILEVIEVDKEYPYGAQALADSLGYSIAAVGGV